MLNDSDWLRYIGDRSVHSEAQAVAHNQHGSAHSYAEYGFGFYLAGLTAGGEAIGLERLAAC